MKNKKLWLAILLTTLSILLIQVVIRHPLAPATDAMSQTTTVTYTTTTNLFPNPERGFYHHTETHSDNYTPLDLNTLQNYRQNENITLILRVFYLEDFVSSDINQTYLDNIQADFAVIRQAGLKAVIRFAYTNQLHFAPDTTWPPIPPYGDATKAQILDHLEQLRPILQANRDVIAVMQAGFIGIWGEWYYTDHFVMDPSNPGNVTPADWANRGEVLAAILDTLPADRMVQVRTPLIKQKIYGRTSPISPAEAYVDSNLARTGQHNDCLLASDTDFGTYVPPVEVDKAYLEAETKYLPMGGETCNPNPPRSECPTALEELARFHWSYLNIDYHPDVLASWEVGDCLEEVKRRLGYRFTLVEGTYTNAVQKGDVFTIEIKLRNEGWAAPFNLRPVKLLLRPVNSSQIYEVTLPPDPRFWLAEGEATYLLNYTICTPAYIPPGDYELLLSMPDPKPSLSRQSEYAIRLANELVWEDNSGYNQLLHTIVVNETATSPACSDPLILKSTFKVYLPIILRSFI